MITNILFKVMQKAGVAPMAYKAIKTLIPSYSRVTGGGKITQQEVADAYEVLYARHADVKTSAIRQNRIEPCADLQIIVPVYKVERYVVECIESVIRQKTKFSYLVTVINDGSPDGSRDLLRQYEHLPQLEIIDQENRGFSGARNRGLEVIKGRYVTFLDSDDRLHEGAIEALMEAAMKHDADIVQGAHHLISESGAMLGVYGLPDTVSDDEERNLRGFPWGKVFKAKLLEQICFPERYWFEDTICAYLLFPLAGKRVSISNIVYDYRKNLSGITHTSRGNVKMLDTLYITEALVRDAQTFSYAKSDRFYTRQMQQIGMNCRRLLSLGDEQLERAAFVVQCAMIDRYFGDYCPYDADPHTFLNILRGAEYMFTDSFHGCAFSIIMHKSFAIFNRYSDNSGASKNSRIETVCGNLGLNSRRVNADTNLSSVVDSEIDWAEVDKKAGVFSKRMREYLNDAINK